MASEKFTRGITMQDKSSASQVYVAQLHGMKTPYKEQVSGITVDIHYGVYPPGPLGALYETALNSIKLAGNSLKLVLDYGTGSGFLTILAITKFAVVKVMPLNIFTIMNDSMLF
jgi:methylase of polypeptide subunit release factors